MEREKVQRYDMENDRDGSCQMVESDDGDYVLFTALEASEAKLYKHAPDASGVGITWEAAWRELSWEVSSARQIIPELRAKLAAAERDNKRLMEIAEAASQTERRLGQIIAPIDSIKAVFDERDTLRARCEALTHALQDMIALSAGLNDDDEYLGEAQNAGPRIDLARRILAESPTPTDSDSAPAS